MSDAAGPSIGDGGRTLALDPSPEPYSGAVLIRLLPYDSSVRSNSQTVLDRVCSLFSGAQASYAADGHAAEFEVVEQPRDGNVPLYWVIEVARDSRIFAS